MSEKQKRRRKKEFDLPSAEKVQEELSKAESMDDFFGKEGIFSKLFAKTLEQMLEAELSDHLGYEAYEASGRNSGNSRNGYYRKKVRSSDGDVEIQVPRDRNGSYEPQIVPKYGNNTNELEEKILGLYAKGVSTRDIQDTLAELYGVDVSPSSDQQSHGQDMGSGRSLAESSPGSHLCHRLSRRHPYQAASGRQSRQYGGACCPGGAPGWLSGSLRSLGSRWC